MTMRHALRLVLPLAAPLLLIGCGEDAAVVSAPRPALVVQPQATGASAASYPGEVRARLEPQLAFRMPGKVSKRLVEEGERVKANQPLAELDPQDVRLQVQASRAQLAAAQANLALVTAERERAQKLLDRQMVSHSLYDNAQNLYHAGQARLNQARAELEVAGNQVEYAVLRAPQDGVVAKRLVEVGQVVAAGQTVFSLAVDGEREVQIGLPEQQFAQVAVGQPVTVELWSHPGQRYEGRIRELSPSADPHSRTFAARIAFTGRDTPAQLGQSAQVFLAPATQTTLSLPLSALNAEAGQRYVWRVNSDSRLQRVDVRVGPYGSDRVPVLEGIAATDWIVAAGGHVLRDGQQVRPVDRSNRTVKLATKE